MVIELSKYGTPVGATPVKTGLSLPDIKKPPVDLAKYGTPTAPIQRELPQKTPGYFERVYSDYSKSGEDIISGIKSSAEQIAEGQAQGNLKGLGNVLGGIARAGLRTVGGIAEATFAPITEAPIIKDVLGFGAKKIAENKTVTNLISSANDLAVKYPEYAKDIKNIIDISTMGVGGVAEKPLIAEGKALASDVAQGTKVLLTPSEETVQKKVVELFNKSIKPTAKKTEALGAKYENDTLNALKTIRDNADNLNIEDASGELISGRTPQTINELSQGIDQTKKLVFNQYDSLAKKAGTQGAVIDAKPIADEIAKVAQNKALQITNPEVVKYAQNWESRLRDLDVLDTETTQAVIQNLNNNLQAFYKNPTYGAASQVAIDAGVANNFRVALDKAIEGATGEQYQVLKRQYAALKAIENDVTRAAMRDARKNVKGLLDYTDMFTGGQMLSGIVSLNPAMFTKGAVERGLKEYIKFLNDPNRAVANIFEQLGKTSDDFIPTSKTINAVKGYVENPKLGGYIEDVGLGKEGYRVQPLKSTQSSIKNTTNVTKNNATDIPNTIPPIDIKSSVGKDYRSTHQIRDAVEIKSVNLDKLKEEVRALDGYISNEKLKDFNNLKKLYSNPNAKVKIYRASPVKELNAGDWVTTNKTYANNIKQQNGGKVYEYTVNISDLNLPKDISNNPSGARFSAFQFNPKPNSPVSSLISEAKKYKNAEDFVNSHLMHGTTEPVIKDGRLQMAMKSGQDSGGIFLSDNPNVAQTFTFNKGDVYYASPKFKSSVLDLTNKDGIDLIKSYIGKTYKTLDGDNLIFTKQDFDLMFPNGKTDFASVAQYPELVETIAKKAGKKGIAFEEYAGGSTGKTFQMYEDIPVFTKKELTDIWKKSQSK